MGYEGEEIEGYYCLLIAILGNFDASEARFLYEYGPDHPVCRKILKKRPPPVNFTIMSKEEINQCMCRLFEEGYSKRSIADLFGCYPSTVNRRISIGKKQAVEKKMEERRNQNNAQTDRRTEELCRGKS
ncbi:hypothetical protein [Hungatella hathewayi]|uniref:hypothetical protein n=1 Tax=Hungatella hathewayi TaxID=154046 RepID=UPI0035664BC3